MLLRDGLFMLMVVTFRVFEFGDNSTALYHVAVIMDPLSETAQRWSSLLEVWVVL